uniref:Fucosyltransferase n=1 Tax=Echeneis naucrates TaxID=173247 RepID=A0A665UC96_ECHNA
FHSAGHHPIEICFSTKCAVLLVFYSVWVAAVGFLLLMWDGLHYLPGPFVSSSKGTGAVTLLIWTHPFDQYRELPDCFALFRIDGCKLTDDERAYGVADAVLIHHREVATGTAELPPEPRPSGQKWIWMNYESPSHTPRLRRFEGVFNLTMSYRTDSDIFLTLHISKPRLVAWVISNWSESHARVAFYYQLRRFVPVDVFGRAGRPLPEDSGGVSLVQLVGRYQFYLALENSQHTDYITEKLWNAVRAGAVPVVLGPSRKTYERLLPPEAFIHVDDFPSVRGLARYLLMLRQNPAKLRRHLDWRAGYSVYQPAFWAEHYCTACRGLRRSRARTDVVPDLTDWFRS